MLIRKLVAIDIAGLGPKFILAEFGGGVVLLIVLGFLSMRAGARQHAAWEILLGIYFLGLAVNYACMLGYAVEMVRQGTATAEVESELHDRPAAYRRYRRFSLILLVPLSVPVAILVEKRRIRLRAGVLP